MPGFSPKVQALGSLVKGPVIGSLNFGSQLFDDRLFRNKYIRNLLFPGKPEIVNKAITAIRAIEAIKAILEINKIPIT